MRVLTSNLTRTALAGAAAVLLAGCGSDNGDDVSDAAGGGSSDSVVSVTSVDGTEVLVDAEGRTLYTADVEKDGQIRCVAACTSFWEPLLASAADAKAVGAGVGDQLAVVDRPDGESQLTYEGLPLYTFTEEGAGELQGDGFTDDFQGTRFVWAAATTDGSSSPSGTPGSDTPDDSGGGYDY